MRTDACAEAEDRARATRTPPNDDLTPETFASADWRKALDDDNGVVANLDDIFKTCSTLLSTQVYPTTGKAPIHVSKPKQSRWDQLLKFHGKLDLQKWTVKRVDALFQDVAKAFGVRPDVHSPMHFSADTTPIITGLEECMND